MFRSLAWPAPCGDWVTMKGSLLTWWTTWDPQSSPVVNPVTAPGLVIQTWVTHEHCHADMHLRAQGGCKSHFRTPWMNSFFQRNALYGRRSSDELVNWMKILTVCTGALFLIFFIVTVASHFVSCSTKQGLLLPTRSHPLLSMWLITKFFQSYEKMVLRIEP